MGEADQGIDLAGMQLAQAGGNECAEGMGYDAGRRPAMLGQDLCKGMGHIVHVQAAWMQAHGHMWHVQQDHRPVEVLLPHELADEAPVRDLHNCNGPCMRSPACKLQERICYLQPEG